MTITIQRGRQFAAGDATAPVFDEQGKAGSYLSKAAEKLVAQGLSVQLGGGSAGELTLATADDWKKFIADHASTKDAAGAFAGKFGITFGDFLNAVDDVAASDDKGVLVDLRPGSEVAKMLSLDSMDNDYALKSAGQTLSLTGAAGATASLTSAGVPTIGPDILATPIGTDYERDRAEQECWADFKTGDGSTKKFKDNTGPAPFASLTDPKWDNAEAMALVNRFTTPLHLEKSMTGAKNADGTPRLYQDGAEMFRETYYDDKSGALSKAGASVRARVRFDDDAPFTVNRVLIQGKEGRDVDASGNSVVHKFEKRFEGNYTDEKAAQTLLVTGKESGGQPLKVAQKLYQLAKDRSTLPDDGNLRLEPKYIVLQKRRRTHLQIDSLSEVQTRRTALKTEMDALTTANQPVPAGMTAYAAKLDEQIAFLTQASDLLRKYGQYMASGECFIVSADRFSVYDPAARKDPPTDIDDEVGRIGKGPLHIEAEWDSASSDGFSKAIDKIDEQLKGTPANKAELEADKAALQGFRQTFRKDVQAAVDVLKERLTAAGLTEEPTKRSKDQRAQDLADKPDRPVFWL